MEVGFLPRLNAWPSEPFGRSQRRAVPSLDPVARTSRFFGFQARQLTFYYQHGVKTRRIILTKSRCSLHDRTSSSATEISLLGIFFTVFPFPGDLDRLSMSDTSSLADPSFPLPLLLGSSSSSIPLPSLTLARFFFSLTGLTERAGEGFREEDSVDWRRVFGLPFAGAFLSEA